MPQSSLTAWLKKPAAVPQAPKDTVSTDETARTSEKDAIVKALLPTPPQSTPEDSDGSEHATRTEAISWSTGSKANPKVTRPSLPPNVHLRKCTKEDIPAFKQMNSLLLPIRYPDSFYREILEDSLTNDITLLATWHDDPATKGKEKGRLVGAIRCRLFAHPPCSSATDASFSSGSRKDGPMLYLSTLVLLSPYRSHGIASHMLNVLSKRAVEDYGINSVGAHVWEANADGLEWYRKRGFKELGMEKGYYRRLKPSGAVVVQRDVSVLDFVGG
ncbi:hypothetical protein LTR36_000362 [Oleoguttula mirabilis]|uniref:N-acetyltransferase domain-containing protein n=1 Tax=Oleoguttula mirabilis TaxID=1507867 RepID=A0AAV9JYB6_9PEZI|nr:hypothetical protein LTR36_000362 [Oleoguttula mirabilis]